MFRRNRWNHFVRIRYASWRRHSSKFRNNSNRQPRMPTTRSLKAGTLLSTASWTRAVTPCFPTASGSASIRFPPSRDILAWSRSSPTRSQDNGSRALRWFLCPRLIPQGVGISMTYMRRYALSAMLGIVTEVDTDGEFTPDKLNRPQKQKNAVNASQRGKTTQDDSGEAKKDFIRLKSDVRGTFPIASLGWSFIRNRIGTGRSGVHPCHRKHGGEKGTAFGGGVSLEPATKNLVEVCGVAERAVLDGAALSVSAISTGEMDGRNNQKYGSGRVARNPLLWTGTGCGTANGKLAWGPLPICRHVGYRQNVGLPTGGTGCQTLPA